MTEKAMANAENGLLVGMSKTLNATGMQLVSSKVPAGNPIGNLTLPGGTGNFSIPSTGIPTGGSEALAVRMSLFDQVP